MKPRSVHGLGAFLAETLIQLQPSELHTPACPRAARGIVACDSEASIYEYAVILESESIRPQLRESPGDADRPGNADRLLAGYREEDPPLLIPTVACLYGPFLPVLPGPQRWSWISAFGHTQMDVTRASVPFKAARQVDAVSPM